MKTKTAKPRSQNRRKNDPWEDEVEGYPVYPPAEDIYDNYEKTEDEDLEVPDSVRRRTSHRIVEKFLTDEDSEIDLDVPGSVLDDDSDIIGDEDEENNYYSLGGDEHNNLEEDNLD
jgi:hypothetical protein